jgi:hypothetical protein
MLSSTSASAIVIVSVAKTVREMDVPTVSQQLFAVSPKDPSKIDASYPYDSHHE